MSLLPTRLALRDVHDVEALAREVLELRLREWSATLRPDDRDDALAYLIALAWELERSFDEGLGISYSTYLFRLLRLRLADWYRDRYGDARYGRAPDVPRAPEDMAAEEIDLDDAAWPEDVCVERVFAEQWCRGAAGANGSR